MIEIAGGTPPRDRLLDSLSLVPIVDDPVRTMVEKWDLTVHEVTPEIEAEWRKAAEAAYPTIRGGIVPAEPDTRTTDEKSNTIEFRR